MKCWKAIVYADAVARDLNEARSLGVTGVPFFMLDGRYGVSGAQATEVFSRALSVASGREPDPRLSQTS